MPGFIANLITKVAGDKAADIVTSVGNVADKFITTGQEKEEFKAEVQKEINRHLEVISNEQTKELEIYMADMASARDMNTHIQESDKASWLSKNIAYIIDCVIIGSFILMLIIVAMKVVPESNKELFYTGFGLLGTLAVTTINFHRGTSKGSENKQAFINKMMTK
tara:strand:- start:12942 stop:13436 length:495 start_codon:yes stop_codon:yes gene_type:complete